MCELLKQSSGEGFQKYSYKRENHHLTESDYFKVEAKPQICLAVGPKEVIISLREAIEEYVCWENITCSCFPD